MTENEPFLLDTNVLIYAYDKNEEEKRKKAVQLLKKCWEKQISLAISNQNLAEFAAACIKKLKVDNKLISDVIEDINNFEYFQKISYSAETIMSAINISKEFQMSFWDSLIAATMRENNVLNIYTENTKDFKVPWINSVNPFTL